MNSDSSHANEIGAAGTPKSALIENIVIQVLGFAALALIVVAIGGKHTALLYAAGLFAIFVTLIKPTFAPYLFILSFFTMKSIFTSGRMLSVHVTDAAFILLIFAFVSNKKLSVMAALKKQRFMLIALTLFALWTLVGFAANFYNRTGFENITSLYFIFNFFTMPVAVILFSQPQWKEVRDKALLFYVICAFCEIVIAILIEVADGARSFSDFHKFTGTLGGNHATLASVLALSFGVAMCAFFELRGKAAKLFSLCVAAMCAAAILLSGSRGIVLGVLLAVPTILFLGLCRSWAAAIAVSLPMAAVAVMFRGSIVGKVVSALVGSLGPTGSADVSSYGRLLIWERVYEYAVSGPWLQKFVGIGVGAFTTLRFNYFLEVGNFTTGAHNNFMHVFVEAGIVGLIIYLVFFAKIIKTLTVRLRRKDYAAGCFLFSTLAMLFSGLTQETFWFNPTFARLFLAYLFFYLIIFNFRSGESEPCAGGEAAGVDNHKASRR